MTNWDFIIVTECWLKHATYIPILDEYDIARTYNNLTQNEGVVVYFKNDLRVTVCEPNLKDANCLMLNIDPNTIIIAIYRPPGYKDIDGFILSLNDLLSGINHQNIIIIGDINIDIGTDSSDVWSHSYLNLLASHGILPAHLLPTHNKTCLDHVMSKTKYPAFCYVAETSITDHEAVIFVLEIQSHSLPKATSMKKIDYNTLDDDMKNLNLNPILDITDANTATTLLIKQLNNLILSNTGSIKIPNRKRIKKPWITLGVLRCMKNRDKLHKKLKKDPLNDLIKITYKRYRNFCNWLLKKLKRDYEKNKLKTAAKINNKALWDTIKQITHSKKATNPALELISSSNPTNSADNVNTYFVNIGQNLVKSRYNGPIYKKPDLPTHNSSFVLTPTDEHEVITCIMNLKKVNSASSDGISGYFLKRYAPILSPTLTHIFNMMFHSGVFPAELKLAEVVPIHKSGGGSCVNNYRPISLLPPLSKIAEKLINKRLVHYLESLKLLSPSQFGFRAGISTSDAVHDLTDCIVNKLDNKQKVITIFLDLCKAFDTVSVPLLLDKLEKLGIRNNQHRLFVDYLSGRKQRVRIGDITSTDLPITCGVPQGSVLGPTLFLIFINDLCNLHVPNGRIVTFADDTALIFHGNTWKQAYGYAQKGFNLVCSWLVDNSLILNVEKTKYIPFAIKTPSNSIHGNFSIKAHFCSNKSSCSCLSLTPVSNIRYLGVIIDSSLNFNLHIDLLSSRVRKLMYIFKNLRHVSDLDVIKMVYLALCQSILTYGITVWGGTCKSRLIKLERAQRAVIKVSLFLPHLFPTKDLFTYFDVLTVRQLFILNIVLKKQSTLPYNPDTIVNKRLKHKVCHLDNTPSTEFAKRFYTFLGAHLYNKINKILNIYPMTRYKCKKSLTIWLKSLDYDKTESMLLVI
jgi:hypothetical protein